MRVLITGTEGFVGRHLAEFLGGKPRLEIHGTIFSDVRGARQDPRLQNVRLRVCDLRKAPEVDQLLLAARPDWIFHLAAQSLVSSSWLLAEETLATNVMAELHIFEAVRRLGLKSQIHVAGSSEVYGPVPRRRCPIDEKMPLKPVSPYGVSKASQELLAYQYHRSFGLHTVTTRAFNHTGPGQRPDFAASNFARQVALIEAGRNAPVLQVGNLAAVRDFTDVRDVVRAYWLALEKGRAGEVYNLSSGRGVRIGELVDIFLELCGTKIKIQKEPARVRPDDLAFCVGNSDKFRRQTGWRAMIPLKQTLLDLLNDWRREVALLKS